jgi:hypothetical protein
VLYRRKADIAPLQKTGFASQIRFFLKADIPPLQKTGFASQIRFFLSYNFYFL